MSIFYHVGPKTYKIGDVIDPTFGRGYQALNYDPEYFERGHWGSLLMLSRELVFENVRLRKFPHKPSRFDSVYACPSLSDLDAYIADLPTRKRLYEFKYEVEMVNPNLPSHIGDYTVCYWKSGTTYAALEKIAEDWWSEKFQKNEILTLSPLRVVKIIGPA